MKIAVVVLRFWNVKTHLQTFDTKNQNHLWVSSLCLRSLWQTPNWKPIKKCWKWVRKRNLLESQCSGTFNFCICKSYCFKSKTTYHYHWFISKKIKILQSLNLMNAWKFRDFGRWRSVLTKTKPKFIKFEMFKLY